MTTTDLVELLTTEHHDIDSGIEAFLATRPDSMPEAGPLRKTFAALRRHIYLEEEFLFPPIREAGMMMPILVMLSEHGTLWRLMDAIERALEEPAPSRDGTWLRSACEELLEHLDRHNGKEEPIVYARANVDVTPSDRDALADFLRTGQMPAGWTCHGA